jgi:hypothetical protein
MPDWPSLLLGGCWGFDPCSGCEDISKVGGRIDLDTFSLSALAAITYWFSLVAWYMSQSSPYIIENMHDVLERTYISSAETDM